MRGTALDERLEDLTAKANQAGAELVAIVLEVTSDGVVTDFELGQLSVAIVAFNEARASEYPVVQEIAGTLRVTRTALRGGVSSPWTQRRRTEHVRDMSRPDRERAACAV